MWRLIIEPDDGERAVVPLKRETYAIGREEGNQFRLTDRNVSRTHAELRLEGDAYVIEDLDSFNGTYINGQRIEEPRVVRPGDVIQIADYALAIERDEFALAPTDGARPTTRAERPERLVVLNGEDAGKEHPLDRDELVLGRQDGVDIAIAHRSVSRRHCRLVRLEPGRFEVLDEGSTSGILINGIKLARGVLEPGDTLEVGEIRLRYVAANDFFHVPQDEEPVVLDVAPWVPRSWKEAALLGMVFLVLAVLLAVLGHAALGGEPPEVGNSSLA